MFDLLSHTPVLLFLPQAVFAMPNDGRRHAAKLNVALNIGTDILQESSHEECSAWPQSQAAE